MGRSRQRNFYHGNVPKNISIIRNFRSTFLLYYIIDPKPFLSFPLFSPLSSLSVIHPLYPPFSLSYFSIFVHRPYIYDALSAAARQPMGTCPSDLKISPLFIVYKSIDLLQRQFTLYNHMCNAGMNFCIIST